jgi:hypothetical protein
MEAEEQRFPSTSERRDFKAAPVNPALGTMLDDERPPSLKWRS